MEALPFDITPQDPLLRRRLFRYHIGRKPVEVVFRSKKYTASMAELTDVRRAQIAGYSNEILDIQLQIALELNDADPVTLKDWVEIGGQKYLVMESTADAGAKCYSLKLKKWNV